MPPALPGRSHLVHVGRDNLAKDVGRRSTAGPGTYMFNAPGAIHGGISCDLTLLIHCCSGQPDDIVGMILFLASDRASWMTGETIPIDGGRHLTCAR